MTFTLEAGKYYRLRNGDVVGPLTGPNERGLCGAPGYSEFEWYSHASPLPVTAGRRDTQRETHLDIVAEVPAPPEASVGMKIPMFKDSEPDLNPVHPSIDDLITTCHEASYAAGWWHHAETGLPYIPGDAKRNHSGAPTAWHHIPAPVRNMIRHYWPMFIACKIGLIHSEVSEGFEAYRRGMKDDKLAHRLGLETEIADSMIRQFDLAGAFRRATALGVVDPATHSMDLSASFFEKIDFNRDRPDHKVAARRASGGKVF